MKHGEPGHTTSQDPHPLPGLDPAARDSEPIADELEIPKPPIKSKGHVSSSSASDLFLSALQTQGEPLLEEAVPRILSRKYLECGVYSIEYSVFRPVASYPVLNTDEDIQAHFEQCCRADSGPGTGRHNLENYMSSAQFGALVRRIAVDICSDPLLRPRRISKGLSGSYFIFGYVDGTEQITPVGVFKPKDEEPYGPLSPKWSKWIQRTFFPCFFGRSCLITNLGYALEAAASVLDRQLLSFIVPHTDIVHLKSDQFYYPFWQRNGPTYKIGLLQKFLHGYTEASEFFRQFPVPEVLDQLPTKTLIQAEHAPPQDEFFWSRDSFFHFQVELEKLVILDYIMRNTDRGADNWMIRVDWIPVAERSQSQVYQARLKIGAIDSGLAFPWKHPDEWRSFPFGWLFLPFLLIGRPFSPETRRHYLPLLTSKHWWEHTVAKLHFTFQRDENFKEKLWHKQLAVLKGLAFNVAETLKLSTAGPLDLTRRENLLIWDDVMCVPLLVDTQLVAHAMASSLYEEPHAPMYGIETHEQAAQSETDPLLSSSVPTICTPEHGQHKPMSGFEYNVSLEGGSGATTKSIQTDTRDVIIERLEKVESKQPVFTLC